MLVDKHTNGDSRHVKSIQKVLNFFFFNSFDTALVDILLVLHNTMGNLLNNWAMAIQNWLKAFFGFANIHYKKGQGEK